MVDYHNPAIIAQDFALLVKLWHVVNGIFVWEFFTTLHYEWDVLRGNRPCGWTTWVYSTSRVATLMCIILNMVGFDTETRINCQLWATFELVFGYLGVLSSSLLIVLRIIAIWNMAQIVIVLAMGIWVTDVLLALEGIVRMRSTWSPEADTCLLINFQSTKLATFSILVADIVLLLIMLVGLLRMRSDKGGAFVLGRLLWKQGLIWLLVATVAEVPPTVFMILNLNVPLTLITQTPCTVIVTIAATRMHRSLIEFGSSNILHDTAGGRRAVSEIGLRSGAVRFFPNRTEVTVHTERDQFPASQSLYGSADQEQSKAHEVGLNRDVESGPEK